ncbi:uncharacterized protein EI90DRAFT_3046090 [Cantharellus anzutake]|uniref:uncharacterized protein n=1 Tax=Cantharellus anzutake TaxID=1750568 RepID=UPI001905334C|nr:uncharacterized protein EI90DRAFT_3046090 [Cantharellus anzutake]KAF8336536.1 hypothetical protein EI90DRAFT_3046090 [Cantharellus anzutake]
MSTSPPHLIASSLGDWDSPSVSLQRVFLSSEPFKNSVVIEGTAAVDTRFFRRILNSHPSPFAITVALTVAGSLRPLDWNQEDFEQSGLEHSRSNPSSRITFQRRAALEGCICTVAFSISIPHDLIIGEATKQGPDTRSQQFYGVAVKAYDGRGRTTQTNIATFALQIPSSYTLSNNRKRSSLLEVRRRSREIQNSREFSATVKQRRRSFLRRGSILRTWRK